MTRLVDVILPTHAGERWVEEAIASVLEQTFDDWLLTVVDDASPDATAERAERLARAHPGRIEVLRLERARGAAGARMAGIARTKGELIAFLDQDDRWRPPKLARQVECFRADPELGAVHTDAAILDAEGRPVPGAADGENAARRRVPWGRGPELARSLFARNSVRLASAMVRRSCFEAAGGFDASLFGGEDWEFWVRFAARFPVAHLPEVLLERRVHGGNVSRVHAAERARGKLRALDRLVEELPWLGPLAAARRAAIFAQAGLPEPPLALCTALFGRLAAEGVRYVHWKSNEHVRAALAGRTDFDLLVDPAQRERFEALLRELDFKEVLAPPARRFPGMRDRLGFDRESGRLVHLHVHEQLVLGAPRVKNHRLPLEDLLLDDARTLEGVRAPAPEAELLLLLVRAPLKVGWRRIARRWRRDGTKTLPSALVREMAFLLEDADDARFRRTLERSGLDLSADGLLRLARRACGRELTTPELARWRLRVQRALRPHRRRGVAGALAADLRARLGPRSGGRRLPGAGRILALVGADGSGKSTLAGDLRTWLGWKLDVEALYFGIPKRARAYRAVQWLRRRVGGGGWLDGERWLLVARHRVREHRRARAVRARGGIAVADRWPLPELWVPPEPMDGPRLAGRPLAGRERAAYARIDRPDRVFALRAPLETLRRRDPRVGPGLHARKAAAVNALEASAWCEPVDADRPYEQVLLDLKQRIWDLL